MGTAKYCDAISGMLPEDRKALLSEVMSNKAIFPVTRDIILALSELAEVSASSPGCPPANESAHVAA